MTKLNIMKHLMTLCFIIFSAIVSAQTPNISALIKVLNDSVIRKCMTDFGGIDTTAYVLFEKSGYYFYREGNVEFKEQGCYSAPSVSGIITKFKERQSKVTIKINFKGKKTYYSKVKLVRESPNRPWRIKSRLIYRNFQIPRRQPRLLYYSFDS